MEYYYVYCPDCEKQYHYYSYKTGLGKSEGQLKQMWENCHVCKYCKGTHLIDSEGLNDYILHPPINKKQDSSNWIIKASCKKCREVFIMFLDTQTDHVKCPYCKETTKPYKTIDLSIEQTYKE